MGDSRKVHSLIQGDFPDGVHVYHLPPLTWRSVAAVLARGVVASLRREVQPGDALLIDGAPGAHSLYFNQLVGCAFRWLRPRVTLIVADTTWTARALPGEHHHLWVARAIEWWGKLLVRTMRGPRTHFCFLSRAECALAVGEAAIPESQVHFTPFCTTISPDQFNLNRLKAMAAAPQDYVFSGGSASRDYKLLRAAVGTDIPLRVATSIDIGPWPPNVTVRSLSHEEFIECMARSRAVILPLATNTKRSGGQQTYLNAMLLGKPVVVTDAPGVRDYITHGENGYVVPPTASAVRAATLYILDPHNSVAVSRIISGGYQLAERFTPAAYFRALTVIAINALTAERNSQFNYHSHVPHDTADVLAEGRHDDR